MVLFDRIKTFPFEHAKVVSLYAAFIIIIDICWCLFRWENVSFAYQGA